PITNTSAKTFRMLTAPRRRVSTGRVCRVKTVRTRTTRKARTTVSRTTDCRAYGRRGSKSDSHSIISDAPISCAQTDGSAGRNSTLRRGQAPREKWVRYGDPGSHDQATHYAVDRRNPPHLPATGGARRGPGTADRRPPGSHRPLGGARPGAPVRAGPVGLSGLRLPLPRAHPPDQAEPLPPLPERSDFRAPVWHRTPLNDGQVSEESAVADPQRDGLYVMILRRLRQMG